MHQHNWQFHDMNMEGATKPIEGVDIWQHRWQSSGEKSFKVPHPQYAQQKHILRCYRIDVDNKVIEFAAGEVSNMVWCLYVKTRPIG